MASRLDSTLAANEARTNFYQMLEEVGKYLRRFVITHRGLPRAVVLPLEDVEAWEETLEILSDKKLLADILKSESERKAGKVVSEEKLLKELGISSKDLK